MESNGNSGIVRNLAGLHPFSVFPEEVWPFIGQKLGDSAEILKLIQTIPEIEGAMQAKKRYWLFDQIIPHLSKFLNDSDKLTCRQVCSQWSHAVDNYLENHPSVRAYDHRTQVTGQIRITNEGRPTELHENGFLLMSHFNSQDKISNFLEKMGTPPGRWRNPFLYRVIIVNSTPDIQILTGMEKVIVPFGQHIWSLLMVDLQHREPKPFFLSLREWLAHLPNLKTLGLILDPVLQNNQADPIEAQAEEELPNQDQEPAQIPSIKPDDSYLELWNTQLLPPLPHLEALVIKSDFIPSPVVNALVSSYSHQIRGLDLPIDQWKPEFYSAFPNLTELSVDSIPSSVQLNTILSSIQCPLLYDLLLRFNPGCVLEMGTGIFPWLRRFPLLRNLEIRGDATVVRGEGTATLSPADFSIPSVKYLRIGTQFPFANSDFLLVFPQLEYIHLEFTPQVHGTLLEPSLQIWQPLISGRMYESNVWELLPKLKGLHFSPHGNPNVETCFKRKMYEYEKKLLAQAQQA